MKKSFFIIVCLMLAMTSQVYADEVVIPLTELTQGGSLGGDEPMDDPEQGDEPTNPNQFHATLIDRTLFITSETTDTSHLMVRRIANGDIIVNRDFVTSTSATMPTSGVYHLRIESGHHIFTGNINVP